MQTRKARFDYFREETIKAGFPGLHLQAILWGNIPSTLDAVPGDKSQTQNSTIEYFGFKSMTNYQWVHFTSPAGNYDDWGKKAIAQWPVWDKTFSVPYFPHVSIGWDNNPRFPTTTQSFVKDINPTDFKNYLEQAKDYLKAHPKQHKLITINACSK